MIFVWRQTATITTQAYYHDDITSSCDQYSGKFIIAAHTYKLVDLLSSFLRHIFSSETITSTPHFCSTCDKMSGPVYSSIIYLINDLILGLCDYLTYLWSRRKRRNPLCMVTRELENYLIFVSRILYNSSIYIFIFLEVRNHINCWQPEFNSINTFALEYVHKYICVFINVVINTFVSVTSMSHPYANRHYRVL